MKVLILGIGSPFGDDCLGWVAVEALQRSAALAATAGSIAFAALDRPGAMLLAHWRNADNVLLIDAIRSGAVPGALHCPGSGDIAAAGLPASSHGFGVVAALDLGRALGELPGGVFLYGIEMDPAHVGPSLSPAVQAALPVLVARVEMRTLQLLANVAAFAALPHNDRGPNRAR
ncbi:MAG: hydrogenase maturation protease [Bacteroidota bacterium]